ncbi:MAG: hypothetical protein PVF77_05980 [Anaerolineae bacterium]|jgi:hypothetical protein
MSVEAVVALVLGTVVVLAAPALILSTDIWKRYKGMRHRGQGQ